MSKQIDRNAQISLRATLTLGGTKEAIAEALARNDALAAQIVAVRSAVVPKLCAMAAATASAKSIAPPPGEGHYGDGIGAPPRAAFGLAARFAEAEGRLEFTPATTLALAALASKNALCAVELSALRAATKLEKESVALERQLAAARGVLERGRAAAREERLCPSGLSAEGRILYYRVQWDDSVQNLARRFPALSHFQCSSALTECDGDAAEAAAKLAVQCEPDDGAGVLPMSSPIPPLRRMRWAAVGVHAGS